MQVFPASCLNPSPAAASPASSCGLSRVTEHGSGRTRTLGRESFILFPLHPAAPLAFSKNKHLLLLPRAPWGSSSPPLQLRVPPFRSLLWVRHQRRGVIPEMILGSPAEEEKAHEGLIFGGSPSRVTRIGKWGAHCPRLWSIDGSCSICPQGPWLQLLGPQFLMFPPPVS